MVMVVVAVLLNLMLLWLDILLGHHLRLKLVNLRILILGDYPVLFLLLPMVLIVYCLALIEKLFRPFLVSLMPLLGSLHLLFLLLLWLVLVALYLPLPRAVLIFAAVLQNHINLLWLLRFWLMVCQHSSYALRMCVRFCALLVSSLSLSCACLIFSSVGLSIILSGRFHQKTSLRTCFEKCSISVR